MRKEQNELSAEVNSCGYSIWTSVTFSDANSVQCFEEEKRGSNYHAMDSMVYPPNVYVEALTPNETADKAYKQ